MSEREAIARIIHEASFAQISTPREKWADKIIREHIEPLRAELQRVCDLGERRTRERDQAMTASEVAESRVSALEALLAEVINWAQQRCPCENEKPDPCPFCGASVDGAGLDGVCKAVDATFPRALLAKLKARTS